MRDVHCRLLGGPFDGDEGTMDEPLPDRLWVESCDVPGCRYNGVHWSERPTADGLIYRRGDDDDGVRLYVHHTVSLSPPRRETRALEPV